MQKNDLRKLHRTELLELLLEQSQKVQSLEERLAKAEQALQQRELDLKKAGSIAEASLMLNGVFEAAQRACQQYTENIECLSKRQEAVCAQMEQESREKADCILREAQEKAAETKRKAEKSAAETVAKAKQESQTYWENLSKKLESFYQEHSGLREMLSIVTTPKQS